MTKGNALATLAACKCPVGGDYAALDQNHMIDLVVAADRSHYRSDNRSVSRAQAFHDALQRAARTARPIPPPPPKGTLL